MTADMSRQLSLLIAVICVTAAISSDSGKAPYPEITVERGITAKMRDGIVLRADVYRPNDKSKHPVLLERTPYDRQARADFGVKAAMRGYIYVVQDVRGRYASEGEWYPFVHESEDGYDTVEWAATLPGSDGRVGMLGMSYVGATQLLAAVTQPPHLAGIVPMLTASDYYDGWTYRGGALQQWFAESWSSGLALDTLRRRAQDTATLPSWTKILPLTSYPVLDLSKAGDIAKYFQDWLAHPSYDEYWKQWAIDERYSKISVPALYVGGWYDIFLDGTLRNFTNLARQNGVSGGKQQRLVVGPWIHGPTDRKSSDVDFGASATADVHEMILSWYDYLFSGVKNGRESEKPVKIFVMGRNDWRYEDSWPLARAHDTRYYFHSNGEANSTSGNGSLSTMAPPAEKPDRFIYDPADPVPTNGGGLCCATDYHSGAWDQRAIEARKDVLVYTTTPFAKETEVTGPIIVDLYASSSAVDTDFTAKLVDVWPNGYAQNLTDGIIRARYRNSLSKVELMEPRKIYEFKINLLATSNAFMPGHSLRVEISSSNFPHYSRNLNVADDSNVAKEGVKATNEIFHDIQHPSAIVLPVVH
jgi:putative CocE/NonD family hydrolase